MNRDLSERETIWARVHRWFRRRQLAREVRISESFQKECERIHCFHLAELEQKHRVELQEQIHELDRLNGHRP